MKQCIIKQDVLSISLVVKDIKASKKFYKTLGFTQFSGSVEQNFLIMKSDENTILINQHAEIKKPRVTSRFLIKINITYNINELVVLKHV